MWLIPIFGYWITWLSQASDDYDPSFVTEALREMDYFDTPNQHIELLKDIAALAYIGWSACFTDLCILG